MLPNIIILLHFLSPIPQTHPTTLFAFHTISLICALSVQIFELVILFYFPSFRFHLFSSLFLFLLLNTINFVFSTFTSSFFFLTTVPDFFHFSFTLCRNYQVLRKRQAPNFLFYLRYHPAPSQVDECFVLKLKPAKYPNNE
jgi:hypothetical protein